MNSLKVNLNKNLKPYAKYIPDISKPLLRAILKACVLFLENHSYSKDVYKASLKAAVANEVSQDDFKKIFTCIYILIETLLRAKSVNQTEFIESLKELKFKAECIEDLKVLLSQQQNLHDHFQEMKQLRPMDKFQYRINISLMDNGQGGPTIILHLEHKGRIETINLSLKHFHRFRLTLATILSEIHAIESKRS